MSDCERKESHRFNTIKHFTNCTKSILNVVCIVMCMHSTHHILGCLNSGMAIKREKGREMEWESIRFRMARRDTETHISMQSVNLRPTGDFKQAFQTCNRLALDCSTEYIFSIPHRTFFVLR